MIDPDTLTGEQVLALRTEYKLSRKMFAEMCGFESPSRVQTIEKGSWRKDDRARVATILDRLLSAPKVGRRRGESGAERFARLDAELAANGKSINAESNGHEATTFTPWSDDDLGSLAWPVPDEAPTDFPADQKATADTHAPYVGGDSTCDQPVGWADWTCALPPGHEGHHRPASNSAMITARLISPDDPPIEDNQASRFARHDGPAVSIEAALAYEPTRLTKKKIIGDYLIANIHQWASTSTLRDIGGEAGDRRARELRAEGWDIEIQQVPGTNTWQYRLNSLEIIPVETAMTEQSFLEDMGSLDWNTPKMLSNSELTTWQRCRRKWWFTFYRRLGLNAQDYGGPRATGTRIHEALAAWYVPDGQERTDPREALERVIVRDWTEATSNTELNDEQLAALSESFTKAAVMERIVVEGYMEHVEETGLDANLVITASETALSVDLEVDVDGVKMPVRLIGLLDVRGRRTSDGERVIIDHKSVQNFAEPRKSLHMDSQMLFYMLLEWMNTPEGEERSSTALYNMLRKVKRTANAKPPFYERLSVHHNVSEIKAFKHRVVGTARDILRTTRALDAGADPLEVAYPTPLQRNCSWSCDFFAVCTMVDDDASHAEAALAGLYHEIDPIARYEGKGVEPE